MASTPNNPVIYKQAGNPTVQPPSNPMAGSSGQALQQATSLPKISTSTSGFPSPGTTQAPTVPKTVTTYNPNTPGQPFFSGPASSISAPTPKPPSSTAYPQDTQGQQQFQNAVTQHNQANPANPAPVPPLKTTPATPTTTSGAQPTSTTPPSQVVDTGDSGANQQIALTQTNNDNYQSQSKTLENANVSAQGTLQDETVQASKDQYNAEQSNLNSFAAQAAASKDALNAAAESTDVTERADAQDQHNNDILALKFQQANTDETYNTQIAQQQTQDQQQVIQEESRIAALGGYGNLTSMREMQFTYQQNNLAMNQLVINKNNADTNITAQILQTNKSYNDNLNTIEATKQTTIADNYAKYTDYVKTITEDKNKSEDDKFTAIKAAAKDYTTNVAQIHGDALTARHDASVSSAVEVDRLRQEQITNQRANLQLSTFTDNNGNVTLVGTDTRTGKLISQTQLQGAGASLPMQLQYNPYTTETNVFDPNTGKVIVPGSNMNSTNYFSNLPAGTAQVGNSVLKNDDINKIFNVNGVGGWCGTFANSLTVGPRVGTPWSDKIKAATIKPGTSGFDPSTIRPGMEMVLPEGVKKDTDWGHVVTLLSYDPTTQTINTVQSNGNGEKNTGKGPGHISTQSYNLNDLIKQYGSNFGMIPTTFSPAIQKQLDAVAMPYSPPTSPTTGGVGLNSQALANLPPTLSTYVQQISSGQTTLDKVPSNLQIAVNTALHIYDPTYSPQDAANKAAAATIRATAGASADSQNLAAQTQVVSSMQQNHDAAVANFARLVDLQKTLSPSQIALVNKGAQLLGQQFSDPKLAQFQASLIDTAQKIGMAQNGGTKVDDSSLAQILDGLNYQQSPASFAAGIKGTQDTMETNMKAYVNNLKSLQAGTPVGSQNDTTKGAGSQYSVPEDKSNYKF